MRRITVACCIIGLINIMFVHSGSAQNISQLKYQPEEIGQKVVAHIVKQRVKWRYQRVCAYYGACKFSEAINDSSILNQMQECYKPFLAEKRKPRSGHVDYNVFGIWPFEMYRQTGNEAYLKLPKKLADDEYENPREDGLTALTRFWVDDMYMVGNLQVQAYKSTNEKIYLDRAAQFLKVYCDELQKSNGIFHHREDAPFYWGRGNGWAAAALAEVLMVLPEEHMHYQDLKTAYLKMMSTLLRLQGEDGMWHQLLDYPDSYPETSCTGMFLFAIASGMKKGLLPANTYKPCAINAWNALASYVNENGETRNVCIATNAKNSERHYLKRWKKTGDFHGQAAVLWSATAMIKLFAE